MALAMTTIAFTLMSFLAANAANLRTNGTQTWGSAQARRRRTVPPIDPFSYCNVTDGWHMFPEPLCRSSTQSDGSEVEHCTTQAGAHCYKRKWNSVGSWTAAKAWCSDDSGSRGAYLVVPNSQADQDFITQKLLPNTEDTFIGLDCTMGVWEDGTPMEDTFSWRPLNTSHLWDAPLTFANQTDETEQQLHVCKRDFGWKYMMMRQGPLLSPANLPGGGSGLGYSIGKLSEENHWFWASDNGNPTQKSVICERPAYQCTPADPTYYNGCKDTLNWR